MGAKEDKADYLARHALLQKIMYGKEVPQRLGHFLALDLQHLVMQPIARELPFRVGAAGLGDLIFVVRELKVVAAAVDVERRAQKVVAHGRAFDVPARTPPAPRAVPTG